MDSKTASMADFHFELKPHMKKYIINIALVVTTAIFTSQTKAETIISNYDAPDGSTALLIGVRPGSPVRGIFSMSFTTAGQDYEFDNLRLRLRLLSSLPAGDPYVSIWEDDGHGFPGMLVARLDEDRPLALGVADYTFTAPTLTTLSSNTRYHVVVSNANNNAQGAYGWVFSDPETDPGGIAAFESYRVFNNVSGNWSPPIPPRSKIEINAVGDEDGDGVPDDFDFCPNSILTETVIIGGIDSGVANPVFEDGCTIADLVKFREDDAKNHGQFVSQVTKLAKSLEKDGTISKGDKSALTTAAAQSNVGK